MPISTRSRPSLRPVLSTFGCAAALLVAEPAQAHHSFSMYDPAKLIQLKGTVKEFQWTNPHVMLWLIKDEDPKGEVWTIELPTSPGNLGRMNWTKRSLKSGDHVVVEVSPLRDGQHGGSFKKATLLDTGVVLVASAPGQPGAPGSAYGGVAELADAGSAAPAAANGTASAPTSQATSDAGTTAPAGSSGCACQVQTRSPSRNAFDATLALLGLAWLVRRRQRA